MGKRELTTTCYRCDSKFLGYSTGRPKYCSESCRYPEGPTAIELFKSKLVCGEPDGCWLWPHAIDKDGYGVLQVKPRNAKVRMLKAHRLSLEFHTGKRPADGVPVLHSCDARYPPGDRTNRRCINPLHLRQGSHEENVADRVRNGRSGRMIGERANGAKLTPEIVLRMFNTQGMRLKDLARAFGVSEMTAHHIKKGVTWTHVTGLLRRPMNLYRPPSPRKSRASAHGVTQ